MFDFVLTTITTTTAAVTTTNLFYFFSCQLEFFLLLDLLWLISLSNFINFPVRFNFQYFRQLIFPEIN